MAQEGFLSGEDYLALPRDPKPWVLRGIIPVGGMINLYGRPKTGKSFAALGIALAVSNGEKSWNGIEVVKSGPVAFLQIDTPRTAWADRLKVLKDNGYCLKNIYFADKLMAPYPFNILLPDHQKWLKETLDALKPVLVFIDTIRESHGGDENDSGVMKNVVGQLVASIGDSAGCLISHSRKENIMSGEDIMNDGRGSSYVAGRMDTVMKLTPKHLMYQGRSVANTKIKVRQDPTTKLILLDEEDENRRLIVNELMAENPDKTTHWIAQQAAKKLKCSIRTIERFIDDLQKEQ